MGTVLKGDVGTVTVLDLHPLPAFEGVPRRVHRRFEAHIGTRTIALLGGVGDMSYARCYHGCVLLNGESLLCQLQV